MAINLDDQGRDENLKKVFHDGMNLDSPSASLSYNSEPGKKPNSTANIDLKIQGPYVAGDNVDDSTIQKVKGLARQYLQDRGLLTLNASGDTYVQLNLKQMRVSPIAGTDIWNVSCSYEQGATESDMAMHLANFTFSTSAQQVTIMQGYATPTARPAEKYSINADGTVEHNYSPNGVDLGTLKLNDLPYVFSDNPVGYDNGTRQSVQVYRPTMRFTKDVWIGEELLTFGLMRNFAQMTGTVNADYFCGFEPGEVLFKGVANSSRSKITFSNITMMYWALTLEFECQPNITWNLGARWNLDDPILGTQFKFLGHYYTLAELQTMTSIYDPTNDTWRVMSPIESRQRDDLVTAIQDQYTISKNGWDYFWAIFETQVYQNNAGDKTTIKEPIQYMVTQVYPYVYFCDFFGFGYEDGYISGTGETPFSVIRGIG